jgi:transcriptional accessory protein Tex/SPT6
MSKAKAIYAWWRGLSIWIRVPLCIVLVIALIALVVEGAIRFVFPDKTHLREPLPQTSAAQVEQSSEKLQEITEKADERIAEIKEKINDENETTRDFENKVRDANSFDAIDAVLAKYRGSREARERQKRRDQDDGGED